ncbi:MAG: Glu/Leu/Phe/Val dehydrogenase dimerization domain-containing protein [Nanoarchaeota archaeon]|nr:Glu/Leu/Phe/Val dehydrogenase dimerization domain-containing protein [Nanoarchaeota archaeon]
MQLRTFKTSNGCKAYFAIDTLINNTCCGGVRIKEGLSAEEIKALAHEMTLKLGFWRLVPFGGAKFGISVPNSMDFKERAALISEFTACLNDSLGNVCYFPGTDFGSSFEDLNIIKRALIFNSLKGAVRNMCYYKSMRGFARGALSFFKKSSTDTAYYAALTCVESLKRYSAYCGIKPRTAIILGFGKVGKNIAILLESFGIKIVGVSTEEGAIYDKKGLPANQLLKYASEYGHSFVKKYSAKTFQREDIISFDADAIMPCADIWMINEKNVKEISAKLVISGANLPATLKAEKWMIRNGISYLPSFLCNCGGVVATFMEKKYGSKAGSEMLKAYNQRFNEVLSMAEQKKRNIMAAADIASDWFEKYKTSIEKQAL